MKTDCPAGTYSVKQHIVKASCRKAKGGILGQQLRGAIKLRALKKQLDKIAMKKTKRGRGRGGKMGPKKKRAKKE